MDRHKKSILLFLALGLAAAGVAFPVRASQAAEGPRTRLVGSPITDTTAKGRRFASIFWVTIKNRGFNPRNASITQGETVRWTVRSQRSHQVIDTSGMQLFRSPILASGEHYLFTFVAAGSYPYQDKPFPNLTGRVEVPVGAFPLAGSITTEFTITWASAPPAPGYVFDVQIKRPDGDWTDWMTAQTAQSATFVPDSGVGEYSFRARYNNTANAKTSLWSPAVSIKVS